MAAWLLASSCTAEIVDDYSSRRQDAGTGPTRVGLYCEEACTGNTDCLSGTTCTGGRCVATSSFTCATADDCLVRLGGWGPACQQDSQCTAALQACVAVGGGGSCARTPTTQVPCSQTGHDDLTMTRVGSSATVTVCGVNRARCADGACFLACRDDADCGGEVPVCDMTSGRCRCSATSCRTNASVCQQGVCRCARDADCTVSSDKCYQGTCGCSTVAVCPETRTHPGTSWVCQ
jgi:hypothetical protein